MRDRLVKQLETLDAQLDHAHDDRSTSKRFYETIAAAGIVIYEEAFKAGDNAYRAIFLRDIADDHIVLYTVICKGGERYPKQQHDVIAGIRQHTDDARANINEILDDLYRSNRIEAATAPFGE